jgi:hypothetical protein
MEVTWTTHPNNVEHKDWAGCFRCHDGKHLNEQGESIRIECNLCHSIPLQAPADGSSVLMALSDAYEPESHIDSNWIARHRFEFDAPARAVTMSPTPAAAMIPVFAPTAPVTQLSGNLRGLTPPALSN